MTKVIKPSLEVSKLRRVDQLKGKYREFITDEQILSLAKDKLIPHYILIHPLTNEEYFYFLNYEVDDWFLHNYIKHEKCFYEQKLHILSFDYDCYKVSAEDQVPPELHTISNLYKYPLTDHAGTPPAVYFLCLDNKIVYIGQTLDMSQRMTDHLRYSDKKFSHVFFFPCQKGSLLKIESDLIRQFKPEYNINHNIVRKEIA